MEYMSQGSLEHYVSSSGPLSVSAASSMCSVLCSALATAHERGVVHRDIKPGNILISADGDVALGDFGISVISGITNSSQTEASLSPPHAPPELFSGSAADGRLADIYSLGSTIYYAYSGSPPFGTAQDGGISGLMERVQKSRLPPIERADIPDDLNELLVRMTAKNPESRIGSAVEVRDAFAEIAAQLSLPAAGQDLMPATSPHGATPTPSPTERTVVITAPPAFSPSSAPEAWLLQHPQMQGHEQPQAQVQVGVSPDAQAVSPAEAQPSDMEQIRAEEVVEYGQGSWPTGTDYASAVQDAAALGDPEARSAQLARDFLGMPLSAAGQSAIVFQMKGASGALALRCYTRPPEGGSLRYRALARHLEQQPCKDLVAARWVDEAITVNGSPWPAVAMPWVPGLPLNLAIEDLLTRPDRLRQLAEEWLDVLDRLRAAQIGHGDLQNGNVLVDDELNLRLVDLDGVWIPYLEGEIPAEIGHPNFQHPYRTESDWGPDVDTFPGFVIYLSIRALAADPSLWQFYNGENLIFNAPDLATPGGAEVWQRVRQSPDADVQRLSSVLIEWCSASTLPTGPVRSLVNSQPIFGDPSQRQGSQPEEEAEVHTVRRNRTTAAGMAAMTDQARQAAQAAVPPVAQVPDPQQQVPLAPPVSAPLPAPVQQAPIPQAPVPQAPVLPSTAPPDAFVPNTPVVAEDGDWWVPPTSGADPQQFEQATTWQGQLAGASQPVVVQPASATSDSQGQGFVAFFGNSIITTCVTAGLLAGVIVTVLRMALDNTAPDVPFNVLQIVAMLMAVFVVLIPDLSAGRLSGLTLGRAAWVSAVSFLTPLFVISIVMALDEQDVYYELSDASQIVCWGLAACIVGATTGATRSLRASITGAVGGLVGGFIGGALYVLPDLGKDDAWLLLLLALALIGAVLGLSFSLAGNYWIKVQSGKLRGRRIILDGKTQTLGAASSCKIVLSNDPQIQPVHVTIQVRYGTRVVIPHAPILVNGARVTAAQDLHLESEITIGSTVVKFSGRKGQP
jgi:tRNA A-37 threonylcarbamoyl transferase component Bud32